MPVIVIDKNNKVSSSFTVAPSSLCWYCKYLKDCSRMITSEYYDNLRVPLHWHLFHHRSNNGGISAACNIYVKIFEDLQELIDKPYAREKEIVDRESRRYDY